MKNENLKTRKKVKIIGKQEYINSTTGQVEDFQVISVEQRDFNFHKIWLSHIVQSLDLIGNQKTKLAFWIISNMDSENKICYTMRQMSEKSNISLDTVLRTIKVLIKSKFLVKQNQGVYRVHPDIVFKGTNNKRMNVLIEYKNMENKNNLQENENSIEDFIENDIELVNKNTI